MNIAWGYACRSECLQHSRKGWPHYTGNVRGGAAMALGDLGDPRAIEPLVEIQADGDSWGRDDAVEAWGSFPKQ